MVRDRLCEEDIIKCKIKAIEVSDLFKKKCEQYFKWGEKALEMLLNTDHAPKL